MKKILLPVFMGIVVLSLYVSAAGEPATAPEWSINATAIEACSCPMFCQCYFNTQPAAHDHHGEKKHFCKANLAYKVNKGHYGALKLDGLKFWLTDDLGGDFSQGKMDWTILTFDKSMTKEQRDAILFIYKKLFPVQWNSFETAEGVIDKWEFNRDMAVATLDGGKTAEIRLKRFPGMTNEPVVVHNLKYFGAPRNDGFVLMPNEIETYRVGPKAFEYKGTNGFMITVDMNSKDVAGGSAAGH
ncbi:DUF1326 domain-containing protein [bacterium]|nr:DUF1326 domain-containing protein [bacterium]